MHKPFLIIKREVSLRQLTLSLSLRKKKLYIFLMLMSIYIAHYRKNNASNALIHVLKTSKMVEYRLR